MKYRSRIGFLLTILDKYTIHHRIDFRYTVNVTYSIKFFTKENGESPVLKYIEAQDIQTQAKIMHLIELLQTYGYQLRLPYSKKITLSLYELRTTGKIAVRILYTQKEHAFYLLHAFTKKSEKTPRRDIQNALDMIGRLI